MLITTRHRGGVTILDIEGRLTIGLGDLALRKAVTATFLDDVFQIYENEDEAIAALG